MDFSRLKQKDIAKAFAVTARTVQNWTDAGMPRNADGSYSLPACIEWHASDAEQADQRERLAAAQAEKVEMENAVRRGELAVVADLKQVWQDHIAAARSRLLAMPSQLAPRLAGIESPATIAAAIKAEVYAALTELSEYDA